MDKEILQLTLKNSTARASRIKREQMKMFFFFFFSRLVGILIALLLCVSCKQLSVSITVEPGPDSQDAQDEPIHGSAALTTFRIQGKVQLAAPLENAEVVFYELSANGSEDRQVANVRSTAQGLFTVDTENLATDSYLLAKTFGGSYLDPVSRERVVLSSSEPFLKSIIKVDSSLLTLPITPLHSMVAETTLKDSSTQTPLNAKLLFAQYQVTSATGLTEGDLEVLPQSPQQSSLELQKSLATVGALHALKQTAVLQNAQSEANIETAAGRTSLVLFGLHDLLSAGEEPSSQPQAYSSLVNQFASKGNLGAVGQQLFLTLSSNGMALSPLLQVDDEDPNVECAVYGGWNLAGEVSRGACNSVSGSFTPQNPDIPSDDLSALGKCGGPLRARTCAEYYDTPSNMNGLAFAVTPLPLDTVCPEFRTSCCETCGQDQCSLNGSSNSSLGGSITKTEVTIQSVDSTNVENATSQNPGVELMAGAGSWWWGWFGKPGSPGPNPVPGPGQSPLAKKCFNLCLDMTKAVDPNGNPVTDIRKRCILDRTESALCEFFCKAAGEKVDQQACLALWKMCTDKPANMSPLKFIKYNEVCLATHLKLCGKSG